MSPPWVKLNNLFQKPPGILALPSLSSKTSTSGEQSMMIEPETSNSTGLEASTAPRIFALVVAIDNYKTPEYTNLTGCKNDGQRFVHFLTGVLGVPSSQIVFLANEEATEGEILKQFDRFLIRNSDIQRDEAIVFFFAGHGSRRLAPQGWVTENNTIEILCPHDVYTTGDDGKYIEGISDRAIDALMRKLAYEKGDNIVAVFDCCHSGGLSRTEETTTLRARYIPSPPHPPPADLNRDIWSSIPEPCARAAKTVVPTGFQYKAMASHVLLAACRPDEQAMEDPDAKDAPRGLFTTALVECLRSHSLHDTSYVRLFETLDLKHKGQHPQCQGTNKDRLLFSVNTIRDGETTFRVCERRNRLYVSAGSIHGIAVGTEFNVMSYTQTSVLKARKVHAFETMLEGSNHNMANARATVLKWHHPTLRVHASHYLPSAHVTVVPDDEPADIALHQRGPGRWQLERFDPLIHGCSTGFLSVDADVRRMRNILDAIANFNSYLYRSDGAAASFAGKVKIRLNRIGVIGGESSPVGDDLLDVPLASHSGVDVREAIITDLDSRYCFTLENNSEVDLFPYFFYFDPSDYSVQAWYIPPSPTISAPLKRREADYIPSFALGYGGFGTDPIEFYLPEGGTTDSGFLKVFLTTTYVDMIHVAQNPISEISDSRGWKYDTLKGTWTCETFVLTCKKS